MTPQPARQPHLRRPKDRLDLLLLVLPTVQIITKSLESTLIREERSSREFLRTLRNAAFSLSFILQALKSAGFTVELVEYADRIMQCLEDVFDDSVTKLVAVKVKLRYMNLLCHIKLFPYRISNRAHIDGCVLWQRASST
jgi:hypothetical protein